MLILLVGLVWVVLNSTPTHSHLLQIIPFATTYFHHLQTKSIYFHLLWLTSNYFLPFPSTSTLFHILQPKVFKIIRERVLVFSTTILIALYLWWKELLQQFYAIKLNIIVFAVIFLFCKSHFLMYIRRLFNLYLSLFNFSSFSIYISIFDIVVTQTYSKYSVKK